MAKFERISFDRASWTEALNACPDRIVYQTLEWISFLAETQDAEPVVAVLKEGNSVLGCFSGLIVRKCGLRILGSPFRSWSTPYMGLSLLPSVPRRIALEALPEFAFKELRCVHLEVTDSRMSLEDIAGLGFSYVMHATMEVDLTQSEETLLKNMTGPCRRNIRHAETAGVIIEEARDMEFADDFTAQFKDVLARQGMVPYFGAKRVCSLIKHLHASGNLLMLRARDPEGRCIATGIYPAFNQTAFYNNGASWRQYQRYRPNELLHWSAMRYWKNRGMRIYNMVGVMDFKRKFGGDQTEVPAIYKSKYRLLERLRSSAMPIAREALHLAWRLQGTGKRKANAPAD